MSICVISNSLASSKVPDPTPTSGDCKAIIGKCDAALKAKNEALDQANKTVKDITAINAELSAEDAENKEKLKKPYRNGFLMGGVGASIGMIVGGPITIAIGLGLGLLFGG